jgi:UDP-glucose 6-dehydrogenase
MNNQFTVAVFGLGEAGSLIAADLAKKGVEVHGFDPRDVRIPEQVIAYQDPRECVNGVDIVIALTTRPKMSPCEISFHLHIVSEYSYCSLTFQKSNCICSTKFWRYYQ